MDGGYCGNHNDTDKKKMQFKVILLIISKIYILNNQTHVLLGHH